MSNLFGATNSPVHSVKKVAALNILHCAQMGYQLTDRRDSTETFVAEYVLSLAQL